MKSLILSDLLLPHSSTSSWLVSWLYSTTHMLVIRLQANTFIPQWWATMVSGIVLRPGNNTFIVHDSYFTNESIFKSCATKRSNIRILEFVCVKISICDSLSKPQLNDNTTNLNFCCRQEPQMNIMDHN